MERCFWRLLIVVYKRDVNAVHACATIHSDHSEIQAAVCSPQAFAVGFNIGVMDAVRDTVGRAAIDAGRHATSVKSALGSYVEVQSGWTRCLSGRFRGEKKAKCTWSGTCHSQKARDGGDVSSRTRNEFQREEICCKLGRQHTACFRRRRTLGPLLAALPAAAGSCRSCNGLVLPNQAIRHDVCHPNRPSYRSLSTRPNEG